MSMLDTMTRFFTGVKDERTAFNLRGICQPLIDRYSSVCTGSANLVIHTGGGSPVAMTGATNSFQGIVKGIPVAIATSTDMPALVGSITAGSFNVFCFFIDTASVVTVAMGTEGTTLAKVVFPPFPEGKALVGYLVVTYASQFVGGTTNLDTATTTYVSPTGAFDPQCLVG